MTKESLVTVFSDNVIKQNACIKAGDASEGNKAAKKYIKAFKDLSDNFGDSGRETLSQLLRSDDTGVRAMAASFLLKYKTTEAIRVLQEVAVPRP